jgi:hypothetical protein
MRGEEPIVESVQRFSLKSGERGDLQGLASRGNVGNRDISRNARCSAGVADSEHD